MLDTYFICFSSMLNGSAIFKNVYQTKFSDKRDKQTLLGITKKGESKLFANVLKYFKIPLKTKCVSSIVYWRRFYRNVERMVYFCVSGKCWRILAMVTWLNWHFPLAFLSMLHGLAFLDNAFRFGKFWIAFSLVDNFLLCLLVCWWGWLVALVGEFVWKCFLFL